MQSCIPGEDAIRLCVEQQDAAVFDTVAELPVSARLGSLFLICNGLAQRRELSALEGLLAFLGSRVPRYDPTRTLMYLWQGYLLEQAGQNEAAITAFQNAGYGVQNYALTNPPLPYHDTAALGTTVSFDCALDLAPVALPPVTWDLPEDAQTRQGRVLLLAANDVYLDEFLDGAVESLRENSRLFRRLHIHGIGIALDAPSLRRHYPEFSVGVSYEEAPPVSDRSGRLAWYAAARFLRAGDCLDRYGADLVVADIDVRFSSQLDSLDPLFAGCDVALFRDRTQFPWVQCLAGIVSIRNCTASRSMLDVFHRSFSDRLPMSSLWMMDQSALWTALRVAEARDGLQVCNIGQETGLTMAEVLETPVSEQDKQHFRGEA